MTEIRANEQKCHQIPGTGEGVFKMTELRENGQKYHQIPPDPGEGD